MRNAFFYSPTANPVLLRVEYNITYDANVTRSRENANAAVISKIPFCKNNSIAINFNDALNNITYNNEELITYGWTSSGVYTLFHPGVLNRMQLQLPYILLNLIQKVATQSTDGPEADSFLWDGSYCLPTLRLNLHITSLSCIPSQELFEAVLQQLTSRVSTSNDFILAIAVSYINA